jgi:hypothetical protein
MQSRGRSTPRSRAQVLVLAYGRLRRHVKTLNQLNKIHIQLENRMTPFERDVMFLAVNAFLRRSIAWRLFFRFYKRVSQADISHPRLRRKAAIIESSRAWRRRLRKNTYHDVERPMETWFRRATMPGIAIYSRQDLASKRLVVSFPTRSHRMMVALPDYLEAIESVDCDVLLIKKSPKKTYAEGIPGLGDSLRESIEALGPYVSSLGYESVVVIGTSAGGVPAILAGLQMRAQKIVALGPGGELPSELEPQFSGLLAPPARASGSTSNITIYLGERAPQKDHDAAAFWHETIGADVVGVPRAGHCPMVELIKTRRFPSLLD